MYIELIEILGTVEIEKNKYGKALLFNILDNEYKFNCILYISDLLEPFIILHDDDLKYNEKDILNIIFNKYKLKDLKEL